MAKIVRGLRIAHDEVTHFIQQVLEFSLSWDSET